MSVSDDGLNWTPLCRLDELPTDGTGVTRELGRRRLAVFLDGGTPRVIADTCPHAGGSLGAGVIVEGQVTCPWHALHFDLCTGRNIEGVESGVRSFPTRVASSGEVLAGLPRGTATQGVVGI